MFNAMLRDWRFGVPLMLMLAIAYRDNAALSELPDDELSADKYANDRKPIEIKR